MFGFPIGNGNAGFNDFVDKFTNNADSGFPKIQQREVFYSIKDGNWNDITIWQTASGRIGNFPTINDDVYIRHTITNSTLNNVSINNLFISGVFNYGNTGYNMSVFGNLKCTGTINQTNANINLYGSENYINTYNFNTVEPAITYARNDGIPQPIMPITHGRLILNGISEKYLVTDFVQGASGSTNSINSLFDTKGYNLTFTTPVTFNSTGDFIANGSTLIFNGLVTWIAIRRYEIINSILEFRGGWTWNPPIGTFANSVINFTTNTQNVQVNFSGAGAHIIDANSVNIVGNITLNITGGDWFVLNCPINGTTASSNLTNKALLQFATLASVPSMTTGIWDFTTFANTILYGGNYSATIPSYFTNFHNLTISGTGIKTLGVNTTLNGNLSLASASAYLECSSFNLNITGTTILGNGVQASTLSKNSTGSILFIGSITINTNSIFSFTGNPSIEIRNGLQCVNGVLTLGTGQLSFTTNNQSINTNIAATFNGNVIAGSGIILTYACTAGGTFASLTFNGTLDGANSTSQFRMGTGTGTPSVTYRNATQPMATGILDTSTNLNTWIYGLNNQDIKGSPTTSPKQVYRNLTLNGTGVKTLQGYVSVQNTYTLTAPATLALNGYTLTNP